MTNKSLNTVAIVLGLVTILISTVMVKTFPAKADLPEGYRTPIIAFEFAKTEADIPYLIGNSEEVQNIRSAMREGHKWDMVFPFAYGGFLALLLFQFYRKGESLALYALPLAVLIIPFDINENLALLAIVDAAEANVLSQTLFDDLIVATWLKWLSIAAAVLALSVLYFKHKKPYLGAFGLLYVGLTALAIASGTKPAIIEMMAVSLTPFMLLAFIGQLLELKKE